MKPEEIERRSFEIIERELKEELDPEQAPIIKRVIHTTADFEYAETMLFSTGAIKAGREAISAGAVIITDTNMAKSGISGEVLKKYGGRVECYIADDDVREWAKRDGETRARKAVDKAKGVEGAVIFAVGNAPTALLRICELVESGEVSPKLVIGAPVGFVNVEESKQELARLDIPYIITRGRKGGSTVAAAICNALIYGIED